MSKKNSKGYRFNLLKQWLTISRDEYYQVKEESDNNIASPVLVREVFDLSNKQLEILIRIELLPKRIPEWTIPYLDKEKCPELVQFVDSDELKKLVGLPDITDGEMITIIKNALKGVDHSRKVYRAKNKKYPLALLYDNRFKDKMSQAVKQFIIDKKEQERVESLKEQINPKLRDRNTPPSKVIMHLGPTNSGKTKYAIEEMVKQYKDNDNSIIAYGGPLRMLALEVYHKLCDELGESNVGLITGEQEINPQARIVACTIECVPDHGDVLIVDECHWAMDNDRGKNWTNALQGSEYDTIMVLGPQEVEPHMRFLLADCDNIETHYHDRLVPLQLLEKDNNKIQVITTKNIPKNSAVISFSKKSVIALEHEIRNNTGLKVGSLYGKMPITVRENIVNKFHNGDLDIIVCTDVIGHGINLPIDNLFFAETEKFDGYTRRHLKTWEGAQVAGRAGRYGLSDEGKVGILKTNWGNVSPELIKQYVLAASGIESTELSHFKCVISPTLQQLGGKNIDPYDIPVLINHWNNKMKEYLEDNSDLKQYIKVSNMEQSLNNLHVVLTISRILEDNDDYNQLTATDAWMLMNSPINSDSPVLEYGVNYVLHKEHKSQDLRNLVRTLQLTPRSKESIEDNYRIITELHAFSLMYGDEDHNILNVAASKDLDSIESLLLDHYDNFEDTKIPGYCDYCGSKTRAPWLNQCDSCYHDRYYYNNYYDYSFFEEDREERNEISREWNRLKSAVSREVSPWFNIGDKVNAYHKGKYYPGEVIKVNKVTVKIRFSLKNGDVKEKNIDAVYVAESNGYQEKLDKLDSYNDFVSAEKPERYW